MLNFRSCWKFSNAPSLTAIFGGCVHPFKVNVARHDADYCTMIELPELYFLNSDAPQRHAARTGGLSNGTIPGAAQGIR